MGIRVKVEGDLAEAIRQALLLRDLPAIQGEQVVVRVGTGDDDGTNVPKKTEQNSKRRRKQ